MSRALSDRLCSGKAVMCSPPPISPFPDGGHQIPAGRPLERETERDPDDLAIGIDAIHGFRRRQAIVITIVGCRVPRIQGFADRIDQLHGEPGAEQGAGQIGEPQGRREHGGDVLRWNDDGRPDQADVNWHGSFGVGGIINPV